MKRKSQVKRMVLPLLAAGATMPSIWGSAASGATQYFDTSTAANLQGGSGNWDNGVSAQYWSAGTGGSNPLQVWVPGSTAQFQTGGTADLLTLTSSTVEVGAIVNSATTSVTIGNAVHNDALLLGPGNAGAVTTVNSIASPPVAITSTTSGNTTTINSDIQVNAPQSWLTTATSGNLTIGGTITRGTNGAVNLTLGSQVVTLPVTTNTNGIVYGGWMTTGNDWVTVNGSGVASAISSYSNNTFSNNTNTNVNGNTTWNSNVTINTLRFNNAGATYTATLQGTGTIATGGIINGSSEDAFHDSVLTGGTLATPNGQDLILWMKGAGDFQINSVIAQNYTSGGQGLTIIGGSQSTKALVKLGVGASVNQTITKRLYIDLGGTLQANSSGTTTLPSDLEGFGNIVMNGTGTLVVGDATSTSTNSNLVGTVTLNSGTTQLAGNGNFGATSNTLAFGNTTAATLNLNGINVGVGTLSGSTALSTSTILNNKTASAATLTVGNSSTAASAFTGAIVDHTSGTGTLALVKNGTGSLSLSGNNTYSGGTTVNTGTLIAANTTSGQSSTGSGSVTLNGGTLSSLSGSTSYIGGTLVGGSGAHIIAPGGVGTFGTLDVGGLNLNGNSTLSFDINGSSQDLLTDSGTLSIASGTPSVSLTASGLTASSYTLATYTATGLSNSSFSLATAPTGYHWNVTDSALQLLQNSAGAVALLTNTNPSASYSAMVGTANPGNNTPSSTITLTGAGNGSYNPGYLNNITANGNKGYITIAGFTPGDAVIGALSLTVNGSAPTSGDLTQLISDLNAGATGLTAVSFASLQSSNLAAYNALKNNDPNYGTDPLEIAFINSGSYTSANPTYLALDFSGESGSLGNVLVTDIAAIPEPAGAVLVGAVALLTLTRRRRIRPGDLA